MNALSVDAAGTVHDYVGGLEDLQARRVRFIGEPDKRIAEDYLRIMRFFRIHARVWRGRSRSRMDCWPAFAAALASPRCSAERVRAELLKLLAGASCGRRRSPV